jgi:hypothetical protein
MPESYSRTQVRDLLDKEAVYTQRGERSLWRYVAGKVMNSVQSIRVYMIKNPLLQYEGTEDDERARLDTHKERN